MSQVDEVASGKIAAEFVVADGGRRGSIGSNSEHVGDAALAEALGDGRIMACCRHDDTIHALRKQGVDGAELLGRIVPTDGDHREKPASRRFGEDSLEEEGHHGI